MPGLKTFGDIFEALEKNTLAADLQLPDQSSFLAGKTEVFDDGSGVLLFADPHALHHLAKCSELFVDGTFYVTPHPFKQLFVVHGFILGQQFPLAFGLLPGSGERDYDAFFCALDAALEK